MANSNGGPINQINLIVLFTWYFFFNDLILFNDDEIICN